MIILNTDCPNHTDEPVRLGYGHTENTESTDIYSLYGWLLNGPAERAEMKIGAMGKAKGQKLW